jgi:hypothetical protein
LYSSDSQVGDAAACILVIRTPHTHDDNS